MVDQETEGKGRSWGPAKIFFPLDKPHLPKFLEHSKNVPPPEDQTFKT